LFVEVRCVGVEIWAGWVKPPFEHVAADHERPGDNSVLGELRVIADVDQRRAAAHGATRRSGVESGQAVAGVGE
jgi:hypothetical protein